MTQTDLIWQMPLLIAETSNEAIVEAQLIQPLLSALGYGNADISPKHSVIFQHGRKGRPNEADFAVFDGVEKEHGNCLMVIEAKRPNEPFTDAQDQAESYAMYLRALVYVVTDGLVIEIWQYRMTLRSECVLRCEVKELVTHRGQIEALLQRQNLLAYRAKFREPSLVAVAWDVSPYIAAELARLEKRHGSVSRTLSPVRDATFDSPRLPADALLSEAGRGGVVLARSGMGKTSLAWRLHTRALFRANLTVNAPLPFEISLPELTESRETVLDFAFNRISAHRAGLTRTMFEDLLRARGAEFFCDAFDRVREELRSSLEANLNLLLRDFPRLRLIMFSRGSSAPRLDLPVFFLQPLIPEEQWQLQQAIAIERESIKLLPNIASSLPKFLARIADSPLIFSKIVDFYISTGKLPTNLKEIFESWVDALTRPEDHKPTVLNGLLKGLETIALATWSGTRTPTEILSAFSKGGVAEGVLDKLNELGAIQYSPRSIEVEHEALADFLRAKMVIDETRDNKAEIDYAQHLDYDSFFPVLLSALTTSATRQKELFTALAPLGFRGYLDAVHYRGVTIAADRALPRDELVKHVMSEISDGFCGPATVFFPGLLPLLVAQSTGAHAENVAAYGEIDDDLKGVNFTLAASPPATNSRQFTRFSRRQDVSNAGRVIGMEVLHEDLDKLIASACIAGGPIWAEERVLTRLRFLLHEGCSIESSLNVDAQIEFWEQHRGLTIPVVSGSKEYATSSNEIYDDLKLIRQAGKENLAIWWNLSSDIAWWRRDWDGGDEAIKEFYLRSDAAYGEVVRCNFDACQSDFTDLDVMPRSWRIVLRESKQPFGLVSLEEFWEPVSTIRDINVIVLRNELDNLNNEHIKEWFARTAAQLTKLGRPSRHIVHSQGFAPPFDGWSKIGLFDGKTAVLRRVCRDLRNDFESMFRGIREYPLSVPPFD